MASMLKVGHCEVRVNGPFLRAKGEKDCFSPLFVLEVYAESELDPARPGDTVRRN
jgi:hypothetical protein